MRLGMRLDRERGVASCQGAGRCRLLGVARRSDGVGGRVGRRWGLHIGWGRVGLGPSDGDHGGSQARVGGEDPVVAMAMDAGRWYEPGQSLEQFEGSETKHLAAVHIGLGEPVDQAGLRRGERLESGGGVKPLQSERPPGAVANEPLETRSVLALDANGAIHRKAAGPAPGAHVRRRGGIQEPAPDEPPQNAELCRAGQRLRVSILESGGFVEPDTALDVAGDHTVESEDVEVVASSRTRPRSSITTSRTSCPSTCT